MSEYETQNTQFRGDRLRHDRFRHRDGHPRRVRSIDGRYRPFPLLASSDARFVLCVLRFGAASGGQVQDRRHRAAAENEMCLSGSPVLGDNESQGRKGILGHIQGGSRPFRPFYLQAGKPAAAGALKTL